MDYKLKLTAGEFKLTMSEAVSFDKYKVGITSLEILLHCLRAVKEKEQYWQWIYISLHSAVQAYMVLALSGKGAMPTFSDKSIKDSEKALRNNKKPPEFKLDSFINLYNKTKSEVFNIFPSESKIFVPTTSQDQSINHLNKRRNDFIHYRDTVIIMGLGVSPFTSVTNCLDYIEFLAFQSNNIIWHEEHYKTETERLLSECRSVIALSCSPQ